MADHRTELRPRQIVDSICLESGCDYEGKPAVQGHCHSRLDEPTAKYIEEKERAALAIIEHLKTHTDDHTDYVRTLESYYICSWMNGEFTLDELVRLRKNTAAMRHALEELADNEHRDDDDPILIAARRKAAIALGRQPNV